MLLFYYFIKFKFLQINPIKAYTHIYAIIPVRLPHKMCTLELNLYQPFRVFWGQVFTPRTQLQNRSWQDDNDCKMDKKEKRSCKAWRNLCFQFHCQYANLGRSCVVVFLVTSAPYAYILVGTSKMFNSWHKIERIRELLWDSTVFRASYCARAVTTFTCLQRVNPSWSVTCTKYICGSSRIFFPHPFKKCPKYLKKIICFPFFSCPQNDSI